MLFYGMHRPVVKNRGGFDFTSRSDRYLLQSCEFSSFVGHLTSELLKQRRYLFFYLAWRFPILESLLVFTDRTSAWCTGLLTFFCPPPGGRRHCRFILYLNDITHTPRGDREVRPCSGLACVCVVCTTTVRTTKGACCSRSTVV